MSKSEKALYDELAKRLRGMGPDRLALVLGKSESVKIRITPAEKDAMKRTAAYYGLTVTEYLTRLHALVGEITEKKRRGTVRGVVKRQGGHS